MNNQVGLGIFGTFGEPHGFQQVFYYGAQFQGSLDLDDAAIEFYPGAELYSVRREIVDGVHSICVSIYSYVRELNTERFGTFIGSCIVLQDGFTEAEYIYKVLHSLHEDLMTNEENIENGIIKVAQGADIVIREPAEFVAAQANLIPLNKTPFYSSFVDQDRKCLILPSPHSFGKRETEVMDFLDEALKHYSDTGTLYFSFDRNVYEFVRSAGILSILEWQEYVDRKVQMQQSTAVRTKKGIQKAVIVPSYADNEETNGFFGANGHERQEELRYVHEATGEAGGNAVTADEEEDIYGTSQGEPVAGAVYDEDDPRKPFMLWEQPDEPAIWVGSEVTSRVKEYNRLFNYTNKLIDHINYKEGVDRSAAGKGRKIELVAALLLLLIGGAVAVYFIGFYKPGNELAANRGPGQHRAMRQSRFTNNDSSPALSSSLAAPATVGDPNAISGEQYGGDYEGYADDLAEGSRGPSDARYNMDSLMYRAMSGSPASTPGGIAARSTNSLSASQLPAALTSLDNDEEEEDEPEPMPPINLPDMPRQNIPAAAVYTSKVGMAGTGSKLPSTAGTATVPATAKTSGDLAARGATSPASTAPGVYSIVPRPAAHSSANITTIPGNTTAQAPAVQPVSTVSALAGTATPTRTAPATVGLPVAVLTTPTTALTAVKNAPATAQAYNNGPATTAANAAIWPAPATAALPPVAGVAARPATAQPFATVPATVAQPLTAYPATVAAITGVRTAPATAQPLATAPATTAAIAATRTAPATAAQPLAGLRPATANTLNIGAPAPAAPAANTITTLAAIAAKPATGVASVNGTLPASRAGSVTPTGTAPFTTSVTAAATKPATLASTTAAAVAAKPATVAQPTTSGATGSTTPAGILKRGHGDPDADRPTSVVGAAFYLSGVRPHQQSQLNLKTLYPRPNGSITQRDIPVLAQNGIKNKTLTELTKLIIENAPDVGKYYKGQELQYAAALLNSNRQAFQRQGNDYVCTADYLILHIPAIIKPRRPVVFPK